MTSFLGAAPDSDEAQRLHDADVERDGFVMNLSRVAVAFGRPAEAG